MFLVLRVLFALWWAGVLGAGVLLEMVADDAKMSGSVAAVRNTWFGLNMVSVGLTGLAIAWVWHLWAKTPAGLTFAGKFDAIVEKLLHYPKRFITWFGARYGKADP